MADPLRLVFVDNFDSFTWNLVDEFARRGAEVEVWRNTVAPGHLLARALERASSLLLLSPGPGAPAQAGCCIELIREAAKARVPLFGVCLGHQAMVEAFGGVPSPFPAGRYHSLAASTTPGCLVPVAETGGIVMAVAHTDAPQLGVQFHPESILTPDGGRIIDNVMQWALHARR